MGGPRCGVECVLSWRDNHAASFSELFVTHREASDMEASCGWRWRIAGDPGGSPVSAPHQRRTRACVTSTKIRALPHTTDNGAPSRGERGAVMEGSSLRVLSRRSIAHCRNTGVPGPGGSGVSCPSRRATFAQAPSCERDSACTHIGCRWPPHRTPHARNARCVRSIPFKRISLKSCHSVRSC